MSIGWPQGILLALMLLSIGIHMAKWGERKSDERYASGSFWVANAITIGLLCWGGFFS